MCAALAPLQQPATNEQFPERQIFGGRQDSAFPLLSTPNQSQKPGPASASPSLAATWMGQNVSSFQKRQPPNSFFDCACGIQAARRGLTLMCSLVQGEYPQHDPSRLTPRHRKIAAQPIAAAPPVVVVVVLLLLLLLPSYSYSWSFYYSYSSYYYDDDEYY